MEEKWIQEKGTVTSSAMCGATGLQEWHLRASYEQLGRGEGLMSQSLFEACRSITLALGAGEIESLLLDVWMPNVKLPR